MAHLFFGETPCPSLIHTLLGKLTSTPTSHWDLPFHACALVIQVSINVFSESKEKLAAAEVLGLYEPSGLARAAVDGGGALEAVSAELRAAADAVCEVSGVGMDGGSLLRRLVESRYDPLNSAVGNVGQDSLDHGNSGADCGGDGDDATAIAEPAVAEIDYSQFLLPEFRANTAPRPQPTPRGLRDMALFDLQHAALPFGRLATAGGGGPDCPHQRGVIEITLCHLLELWAVRAVGAARVEAVLRSAASQQ